MKNCFVKAIAILLMTLCILNCSGCYLFYNRDVMVVDEGRHYRYIKYSDKAVVLYFDQSRKQDPEFAFDELGILGSENDKYYEGAIMLKGCFDKFTHANGKIIVLMENKYYVFEIDKYTYPPSNVGMQDYLEKNDWFREYSIEDFNSEFPDSEKYHWIDD